MEAPSAVITPTICLFAIEPNEAVFLTDLRTSFIREIRVIRGFPLEWNPVGARHDRIPLVAAPQR